MRPFECDACGLRTDVKFAVARWRYIKDKNTSDNFAISHDTPPCSETGEGVFFNRRLPLEYVYKYMPEFLAYIGRHELDKKKLKEFVHRIEKGRSYIRRYNVRKKEVKKMIILLEGRSAE